jgi:phosphatidate cytidylyltransferase
MKRVLTALVLIPLVLLAVFKAPSWLFTLLVGAVALLALKEYLDLVEGYGVKPIRWLSYALVGLLFASVALSAFAVTLIQAHSGPWFTEPLSARAGGIVTRIIAAVWPFLFLCVAMSREDLLKAFSASAMSGFSIFYIGFALLSVSTLRSRSGWYPVIFTFFVVWAGDIVAMYTGKAIGRHKMSPRISPNKTWEGAAGSVIGSVIACLVLARFAETIDKLVEPSPSFFSSWLTFSHVVVFAILLNIAAQLGDLVESLIKRGANVKDSGTMLPGHGGILDRIDALLFAAPVALVLFEFVR